jgi:hypothetical protein
MVIFHENSVIGFVRNSWKRRRIANSDAGPVWHLYDVSVSFQPVSLDDDGGRGMRQRVHFPRRLVRWQVWWRG